MTRYHYCMATLLRNEPEDYVVPTYESDYAAWAFHQAMLLRSGQLHLLDRAWIAEEIEDLGHEQFDKLESALARLLQHILKWEHQPERRSRSWTLTIAEQRRRSERQIESNPSLKSRRNEALIEAYATARREASAETDLPLRTFPETCPYSWDEIMTRAIDWPDDAGQS